MNYCNLFRLGKVDLLSMKEKSFSNEMKKLLMVQFEKASYMGFETDWIYSIEDIHDL